MKKIILTLTAVTAISVASAQKNKVVSAYNYDNAFKRSQKCSELQKGMIAINEAIEHESTKSWAKTWYYRGNIYYNALRSKDQACKNLDPSVLDQTTSSYLRTLTLNFDDPSLKKIDLLKPDGGDIPKFLEAKKGKNKMYNREYMSKILRIIPGLSGEYVNKGIEQFTAQDFAGAQKSFHQSVLLSKINGTLDTVIMYNKALAAESAQDFKTAKEVYDELIDLQYNNDNNGPNLYLSMSKIYKTEGDTTKALDYIAKGREMYPNSQNLIFEEIDHFLKTDNHKGALDNLNTAIGNDDQNAFLFYVRGTVYDKLKDETNAVADYKKAVELDPKQHDALFNLGAFYFNKGADKVNEANDLPLNATKKYDALNLEAKEAFTESIPYIEKANEANPSDTVTAEMLIKAYTRTNQFDKAKALKAKYK